MPTRLLDWTGTFGIALFFATTYNQSRHAGQDAAIYLLNPLALNQICRKDRICRVPLDDADFAYSKIYWHHSPFAATAPIAIEPIFINDRMLAQRSMFTVHHDDIHPIEARFPNVIKKVTLRNDVIPAALEFLALSNLIIFSLFPDLESLSGYLTTTSGLVHRA